MNECICVDSSTVRPPLLSQSSPFSIIPLSPRILLTLCQRAHMLLCIPRLNIVQTERVGGYCALQWRTYGFPFWHPRCALFWDEATDTAHLARQPAANGTVTQYPCQPSTPKSLRNAAILTYIQQHECKRVLFFLYFSAPNVRSCTESEYAQWALKRDTASAGLIQ